MQLTSLINYFRNTTLLQNILRSVLIFCALIQTWVTRHSVNSDAISYLDIGEAYFRGDFQTAINSMWSPLYSVILGAANSVFQPSPEFEYPLAHFVNFGLFLLSFGGFEFFLRELRKERKRDLIASRNEIDSRIPDFIFILFAYLIFAWSTLVLIKIKHLVPDLGVAAVVWFIAAFLLRLRKEENLLWFAVFGAIAGIGYLMKAPLLPIGLLFVFALFVKIRKTPRFRLKTVTVLVFFALFALPFITALSLSKDKLTFSENGKINYAWHVNGVPKFHARNTDENATKLRHPTRKVFENPAIFEFGTPFNVTYPVWYDPSYWYDGIELRFDFKKQIKKIVGQFLLELLPIFSFGGFFLLPAIFLLLFSAKDKFFFLRNAFRLWLVLFPSLAAILMYLLIHVESRYLAPFVLPILLAILTGIENTDFHRAKSVLRICGGCLLLSIFPITFNALQSDSTDFLQGRNTGDGLIKAAREAKRAGIRAGDQIASVGRSNDSTAPLARLCRARIVSEIYDPKDAEYFRQADETLQQEVFAAFRKTGAKFVITRNSFLPAQNSNFVKLGETDFYLYPLAEETLSEPVETIR